MQNQTTCVQIEMCLMLNCSIEKYRQLIYKYGIAYLHCYLPANERQRRILEGSKTFWAWYRIQFELSDQLLIDDSLFNSMTIAQRRKDFQLQHNAMQMAVDVKPNDVVLAELYKKEVCHV